MVEAVILDAWPALHDLARSSGCRAVRSPMQKKVALRPVGLEEREHARGHLRIRAVIDGDRDLAARGGIRGPAAVSS